VSWAGAGTAASRTSIAAHANLDDFLDHMSDVLLPRRGRGACCASGTRGDRGF
jgi:hypothetical protein